MNLCGIQSNYIILLRRVFNIEKVIRTTVKDARIYLTRLTEQHARSLHITIVDVTTAYKGGSTLVTLPRNLTPYCDSVNGARDRVTYQKLVTRSRYGLVRCAVGICQCGRAASRCTSTLAPAVTVSSL